VKGGFSGEKPAKKKEGKEKRGEGTV